MSSHTISSVLMELIYMAAKDTKRVSRYSNCLPVTRHWQPRTNRQVCGRVRPKEHRHPTRSSRSLGVVYRAAPDPKRLVTSLESCRSTPELTRSAKRHRVE